MATNPTMQGVWGYIDEPSAIIREVDREVYMVNPSNVPVYQIAMAQASRLKTGQAEFEMQHDYSLPLFLTLDSGEAYTGTTPTTAMTLTDATDATKFEVGAVWRNRRTMDLLQVTNVLSGVVTFSRWPSGNVTAAASGDYIEFAFYPHEQGGRIKTSIDSVITYPINYAALFATPFGVDESIAKTLLYQGDQFAFAQKKNLYRHKNEIEEMIWFGKKTKATGPTGRRLYTSDGLLTLIATYTDTYSAGTGNDLAFKDLLGFLETKAFNTGATKKICFLNNRAESHLMNGAQANIRITPGTIKSYGLSFKMWESPFGDVMFIRAPVLNGPKGRFVFVESEFLKLRVLQNTTLKSNINDPRVMQKEAAYITELGLQYAPEETGSILTEA